MNRNSVSWHGYMPAITTPFDQHGDLDVAALSELVEWLVSERMHGLVILGTTGEWFSLSAQEKVTVYQTVAKQVKRRIPVIAGCNSFTPSEAGQLAQAASAAGVDGILLTPPPYVVPNEEEIVSFYEEVSRLSPLPICAYNWPPGTNIDMTPALLGRLAVIDKIVAFKNSTSNLTAFCEAFFQLRDKVRIFGFTSTEIGCSLVRYHALDGSMGAGAILGHEHPQFFESMWANDFEKAHMLAKRDMQLMSALYTPTLTARFGSGPAVCKEALNQLGLPGGYTRPPLAPLRPNEKQLVRDALVALGKSPQCNALTSP